VKTAQVMPTFSNPHPKPQVNNKT